MIAAHYLAAFQAAPGRGGRERRSGRGTRRADARRRARNGARGIGRGPARTSAAPPSSPTSRRRAAPLLDRAGQAALRGERPRGRARAAREAQALTRRGRGDTATARGCPPRSRWIFSTRASRGGGRPPRVGARSARRRRAGRRRRDRRRPARPVSVLRRQDTEGGQLLEQALDIAEDLRLPEVLS